MQKVSELKEAELDYWVAKAIGVELTTSDILTKFFPSSHWGDGGPIIERELISIEHDPIIGWEAVSQNARCGYGDKPLIAAMRCFVASKFGDAVE